MNRENREFLPRKKADSEAVNYLAFMSGMVTSLLLIMVIWSYLSSPSDIERVLAVADDSSSVSSLPVSISEDDLEASLEKASAEQLEDLLIKLNKWDRRAALSVRIHDNKNRVRVANQMLQMPLSTDQRSLAADSKIEALSAIYGLDFLFKLKTPDVGATLRATANAFVDDPDIALARASRLAILKVDAFESIKNGNKQKFEPILNRTIDLLKQYPEDEFVLSNIDLIVQSLANFDREFGLQVMRSLLERADEFKTPKTHAFFQSLADHLKLFDTKYRLQFDNRWVNGEPGVQKLFETTLQFANDASGGKLLLNEVQKTTAWFEQENQYQRSNKIYQALVDSSDDRGAGTGAIARRIGENGLRRSNLVGKVLEFNGNLLSGEPLDRSLCQGHVAVVLFWSAKSRPSVRALNRFHSEGFKLSTKQVRVLAVCVDDRFDDSIAGVARMLPGFKILTHHAGNEVENSILDQCPVDLVPLAMLVNHRGEVTDVNVPFDEIKASAEYLSLQRDE